ncbi:hypothetical protein [Bacillus gaemokensis]|uniref:hypothetical protein n=1 Tax=Bacillus gaemokensis TaxID=574375 RepID=UPI0006893735|nr:hypothetical protein [Bacillus gaemokensis]KYG38143.1 hypothetical protein AZF08_20560 [Bacillus gaemokensis]
MLQVNHQYYCLESGYNHESFDSWQDFIDTWGSDVDMDYNLLFRWDWKPTDEIQPELYPERVELFFMHQRRGDYSSVFVKVSKADEEAIRKFIAPRWEHMKKLWTPFAEEGK